MIEPYRFDDVYEKVYTYSAAQQAYIFLTTYWLADITPKQRKSTKLKRIAEWENWRFGPNPWPYHS